MNGVYIVCENKVDEYIPKPMDWKQLPPVFGSSPDTNNQNPMRKPFEPPISGTAPNWTNIPLKPRFDPIIPQFYPRPSINKQSNTDNIVCVCKDLDTATHYVNSKPNRYILGPYKIV